MKGYERDDAMSTMTGGGVSIEKTRDVNNMMPSMLEIAMGTIGITAVMTTHEGITGVTQTDIIAGKVMNMITDNGDIELLYSNYNNELQTFAHNTDDGEFVYSNCHYVTVHLSPRHP